MMRKTKLCVASAVAIVMVFTTAAFAGGPTAVKTTKKLEFEGTGNASYFA